MNPRWCYALVTLLALASSTRGQGSPGHVAGWNLTAIDSVAKIEPMPDSLSGLVVVIDKLPADKQAWKIHLVKSGVAVKKGVTYRIRFTAKASTTRKMNLVCQLNRPPWDNLGLFQDYSLSPQWQVFGSRFTATADQTEGKLQITLGDALGSVWIKDFTVEEAKAFDGVFDPFDWKLGLRDPEQATIAVDPAQTNVLKVTFNPKKPSQNPWDITLNQSGFQIKPGAEYRLSFRARATASRPIVALAILPRPPWSNLGLGRSFELDNDWRFFKARFTGQGEETMDAQLLFNIGASAVGLEISDVAIKELTAEEIENDKSQDWNLFVFKECRASLVTPAESPNVVRFVVGKTTEVLNPWHIRASLSGFKIQKHRKYRLRFTARADEPRGVICILNQGRPPWKNLGCYKRFTLTPQWEEHIARFESEYSDTNAQLDLNLGNSSVAFEIAAIKIEPLEAEQLVFTGPRPGWVNAAGVITGVSVLAILAFWRSRRPRAQVGY